MERDYIDRYRRFMAGRATLDYKNAVGGIWDEMGAWQLELLRSLGLSPDHSLLDLGCGSFRGGRKLIPFLSRGRYVGADISPEIMTMGLEALRAEGILDAFEQIVLTSTDLSAVGAPFDFILAQSVFSHTPASIAKPLFENAAALLAPHGRLVFTYFQGDERYDLTTENAYFPDGWFEKLGHDIGLTVEPADIAHPRGQKVRVARARRL